MIKLNRLPLRPDLILPASMAISIALLCFYVDEGKYSFDGLFRPGNLFFLMVYAFLFFGFQLLVQIMLEQVIPAGKSWRRASIALSAISLPLALVAFFWVVEGI